MMKMLFPVVRSTDVSSVLAPLVKNMIKVFQAELHVFHVEPLTDQFIQRRVQEGVQWLDRFVAENFSDCSVQKGSVMPGDPAVEILKYIDAHEIDCVLIGTHGTKGIGSVLFGSVTKEVVGRSPVPVLTINPYLMTKAFRKRNAEYLGRLIEQQPS